jgi:HrpA-like RNA helicase
VKAIKEMREFLDDDTMGSFKDIHNQLHFNVEELHGALKPSEKEEVLRPKEGSGQYVRVILASRIAETAITIQDVYYVLDSGFEREYYFDEITKMNTVKETRISKSSAEQRKGRAGRTASGFCFKMYKEEDEARFSETKVPEILRMDIADLLLMQIELAKMFDMSDLMFSDQIGPEKLMAINNELKRIEAIKVDDSMCCLTNKGQFILRMHCSVLVSAFIYECYKRGIHDQGLVAAIALENIKGFFKDNVVVF